MILLNPFIIIIICIEFLLIILVIGSTYGQIKIYRFWDFYSFNPKQYRLENINYLLSISGKILALGKLISIIFIIYLTDSISSLVTGAMCAAGIFDSVNFSNLLLVIRILTIFFILLWIILDREDIKQKEFPFVKKKSLIFFLIFIFTISDFLLLINFLLNIEYTGIVRCCGSIYSSHETFFSNSEGLLNILTLPVFLIFSIILIIMEKIRSDFFILLLNLIFIIFSIFIIIHFFSPYIYELPTHHCPFCLFKPEYNYIGYPIFLLLLGGSFAGIFLIIIKYITKIELIYLKRTSFYFKIFFLLIILSYPILYFCKNGVLL